MENLAGDLLLGSKANFSFQFIASDVWYSVEKLTGDLLLPILPTLFIHFVQGRLGELRSGNLDLVQYSTYNNNNNNNNIAGS